MRSIIVQTHLKASRTVSYPLNNRKVQNMKKKFEIKISSVSSCLNHKIPK